MNVTFTVAGVSHTMPKLTFAEGAAMEKAVGRTFVQISKEAQAGSIAAAQALVWVTLKRATPTLTFAQVGEMAIEDVQVDLVPEEDAAPDPQVEAPTAG